MLYDGASSLFGLFQALLASCRSQMVFSSVDGNRSAKKPSYPHWVIIKFPYLQEEISLASDTKTSIRTREIGRMGKAAVSGGLGRELLVASMQLLKSLNSAWRLHKRLYQVLKADLVSIQKWERSGGRGRGGRGETSLMAKWQSSRITLNFIPVLQEMKARPRQNKHNRAYLGKT